MSLRNGKTLFGQVCLGCLDEAVFNPFYYCWCFESI